MVLGSFIGEAGLHLGIAPVVERSGYGHAAEHLRRLRVGRHIEVVALGVEAHFIVACFGHGDVAGAAVVLHEGTEAVALSPLAGPVVIESAAQFESIAGQIANPANLALAGLLVILDAFDGLERNHGRAYCIAPRAVADVGTDEPPQFHRSVFQFHIVGYHCKLDVVRVDGVAGIVGGQACGDVGEGGHLRLVPLGNLLQTLGQLCGIHIALAAVVDLVEHHIVGFGVAALVGLSLCHRGGEVAAQ